MEIIQRGISESKNQPFNHWFAARFFDSDPACAQALKVLVKKALKLETWKPFLQELNASGALIATQASEKDYFENKSKEISIDKVSLVYTYREFCNFQSDKRVEAKKVLVTMGGGNLDKIGYTYTAGISKYTYEGKEITRADLIANVKNLVDDGVSKVKMQTDPQLMMLSEILGKKYDEVEKINPRETSVNGKVSASAVMNFVKEMPTFLASPMYMQSMQKALKTTQNEIPIARIESGKEKITELVLPKIEKNFLNADSLICSQDICVAVVENLGITLTEDTNSVLRKEFLKKLEAKTDESILLNESWLSKVETNQLDGYVPIYTGLKSQSWVLRKDKDFKIVGKEAWRYAMGVVRKMSRFYGLWIRAKLDTATFMQYISALGLRDTTMISRLLLRNYEVWNGTYKVEKFRETPMKVTVGNDNFGGLRLEGLDVMFHQVEKFEEPIKEIDRDEMPMGQIKNKEKKRERDDVQKKKKKKKKEKDSDSDEESSKSEDKGKSDDESDKILYSSSEEEKKSTKKRKGSEAQISSLFKKIKGDS